MAPNNNNKVTKPKPKLKNVTLFSFFGKVQPKKQQPQATAGVTGSSKKDSSLTAAAVTKTSSTTTAASSKTKPTTTTTTTTTSPSSSSSSTTQTKKNPLLDDIVLGKTRLDVYWQDDDTYYPCLVTKKRMNKYFLEYDDGTTEWLELNLEQFRILPEKPKEEPTKKRRTIQEDDDDDDEQEFEFNDDMSEDDDGSVYNDAAAATNDNDDDDASLDSFIVDEDDDEEEDDDGGNVVSTQSSNKNKKRKRSCTTSSSPSAGVSKNNNNKKNNKKKIARTSLDQFKADKVKITQHNTGPTPQQITPLTVSTQKKAQQAAASSPPTVHVSSWTESPSRSAFQNTTTTTTTTSTTNHNPPMFVQSALNPAGAHVHNHLKFLQHPRDLQGRSPDDPEYDPRTLKVVEQDWMDCMNGKKMTDAVKQWWDIKSQYFDTVLLFKTGKFYELFHMDADVGVQVCNLIYMKGHVAHSGFPEISYGTMADKLVRAGYKVARVEQTETPDQLAIRKKNHKKSAGPAPKCVNREVCSVMTLGTRTFCFLDNNKGLLDESDPGNSSDITGPLLAIREVILDTTMSNTGNEDDDDDDDDGDAVQPVCEYGVTLVDAIRGIVTIGQFADDVLRSRMTTLLTAYTPAEILLEGGDNGASETLRSLIRSLQTTNQIKCGIEEIRPNESFPKSTAIDSQIRKLLERGVNNRGTNSVQPWDVEETLQELHRRKYYPSASKNQNTKNVSRWPPVLRTAVEGGAKLALSSMGAALYYLQRSLIDHEILSMCIVKAYIPPESTAISKDSDTNGHEIKQLAERQSAEESGLHDTETNNGTTATSMVVEPVRTSSNAENEITYMALDGTTLHNLEILTNAVDHKVAGSLWSKINFTKTPHGSRMLRAWLLRPLFRKADIERRLDAVEELTSGGCSVALKEARGVLAKCGDIERLLSRVHSMSGTAGNDDDDDDDVRAHPNERAVLYEMPAYTKRMVGDFSKLLNGLRNATQIPEIFEGTEIQSGLLQKIVRLIGKGGCFPDMVEDLDWFFTNFDCDKSAKGLFEPTKGLDEAFDSACETIDRIIQELNDYKVEMCNTCLTPKSQAKSTWKYSNTKPDSKDKYMIELPASVQVPDDFIMKGKRGTGNKQINKYRTPFVDALVKDLEAAFELQNERKARGMQLIFAKFDSKRDLWNAAAQATAMLDALGSLAQVASKTGYKRPKILDCPVDGAPTINITQGRHPCVENNMGANFIPNDLYLGSSDETGPKPRVLLLSGPNMGGKSTLLRQTCLITILSQLGSFVPAAECEITPVDRIFTRLGASDRILLGQSTFFVELAEMAAALRGASRRSLVIMDELGRGTSTFDGTAIASATVQHLVERSQCISLFATHYHSLLDEWKDNQRVRLGHMECLVEESEDDQMEDTNITFLYTLGDGVCPKSFGINVARLAGLPHQVLTKAKRVSSDFEKEMNTTEVGGFKITARNAVEIQKRAESYIEQGKWEDLEVLWKELQEA